MISATSNRIILTSSGVCDDEKLSVEEKTFLSLLWLLANSEDMCTSRAIVYIVDDLVCKFPQSQSDLTFTAQPQSGTVDQPEEPLFDLG